MIAVVEDEPELQALYRLVLASRGYAIAFIAANADDAVASYAHCTEKPDLVIMDRQLNRSSGIDAARRITALDQGARILFATADADLCREADVPGVTGILQKPFSMVALYAAIERALARDETGHHPRRRTPSLA